MKRLILGVILVAEAACGQHLKRQAQWEFQIDFSDGKAIVKSVGVNSAAYRAGLRERDVVATINDQSVPSTAAVAQLQRATKGGDVLRIHVVRSGKQKSIVYQIPPKLPEPFEGVEIIMGESMSSFGYYVRTITTRPTTAVSGGKMPALFFVGWLSCDPVEVNPAVMDGWAMLIRDFATKSGMVFMRVEKPGMGDSQGPPCEASDLRHDLAAYRAAFGDLKKLDFVDSTRIIVFGGSIGGALAPVLMRDENPKGIVVANTFSRTWFEHFLDFERTRLAFAGKTFTEVNRNMKLFSEFYADYLLRGKTPGEVLEAKPHLAGIWYDKPGSQFGRPSAYHHQVQDLDVPAAWEKTDCPVLVIYGEYDWIMSRQEHEYIAHVVNSRRPGLAELKIIPGMDHHFSVYKTPREAFDGNYVNYSTDVFAVIQRWVEATMTSK